MNSDQLFNDGFSIIKFSGLFELKKLQDLITKYLSFSPEHWHLNVKSQIEHNQLIVGLGQYIAQSDLIVDLLHKHIHLFKDLCGPDIDIQKIPDIRITRPFKEKDVVNWHRDTFYGGSPWQLNIWFPLFNLPEGAGLLLMPGSHIHPSFNVRHITDSIYPSDMMDDSISKMDPTLIQLIAPSAEEAVIFFGCAIHRACNPSNLTRFSLDIRLRSAQISDGENEFYKPFCRGLIGKCVTKFLSASTKI